MGDRYILKLKCAYCSHLNEDIWYAPTSSSDTFRCKNCQKINFITSNFRAKKIEDILLIDIFNGFSNTTTGGFTDEEIKRMCQERLKEIKNEKIF